MKEIYFTRRLKKIVVLLVFAMFCKYTFAQNTTFGDGSQVSLTVTTSQVINNYYEIIAANQYSSSVRVNATGMSSGNYLLMQMTGTNAGIWEFIDVYSTSGQFLLLSSPTQVTQQFTINANSKAQAIQVPNYTAVTVNNGGVLTCLPYNPATGIGGILVFKANGTFTINTGGKCDVSSSGFPANPAGSAAIGGIGGAGGNATNIHAALASIPNTGLNGGGNGGLQMNNANSGNTAVSPTYPGVAATAGNATLPITNPAHPNLYLGACGLSGNSGNSGKGAGGGGAGGGANPCNDGQNGESGGNGGAGGIGGAGGGLILVFASTTDIHGNAALVVNGGNGSVGQNGSSGGKGGNGANGCGSCTVGGAGGGGNGANGGNGGNGGSGGASGFIYIKKSSGTTLNNSICQLLGGSGANGGNGGIGGVAGLNATLVGTVSNCQNNSSGGGSTGTPTVIPFNSTCNLTAVMNALATIGGGSYTTQTISTTVTEYSLGGNTVTIDATNNNRAIVIAVVNGLTYHAVIDITNATVSILTVLQNVLNGNTLNANWNGNDLNFTNGSALASCDILPLRNSPVDGNAGSGGSGGSSGGNGDFYEDIVVVPTCTNVNSSFTYGYDACGSFGISQAITDGSMGASSFFASQSDPIVASTSSPGSNSDTYTATSSLGCTYTYTANYAPGYPTHSLIIYGTTNSICAGADGTVTYDASAPSSSGNAVYSVDVYQTGSGYIGNYANSGTISNLAAGTYSMTTVGCGPLTASTTFTIGDDCCVPVTISGNQNICLNSSTQLTASIAGGVWGGTSYVVTVSPTGLVTSNGYTGYATITYTTVGANGNNCVASFTVNISAGSIAPIIGSATVCPNATTNYSSSTTGGIWTWNNTNIGSIVASSNSVQLTTNNNGGSGILTYTVNTGVCIISTTKTINVANATAISGTATICPGGTYSYSHTAIGGSWNLSNTSAGTLTSNNNVTQFTPAANFGGNVTLNYTYSSGGCTLVASKVITVVAGSAGVISGPTIVCSGNTAQYTSTVPGGTWIQNISSSITIDYYTGLLTVAPNLTPRSGTIYYQVEIGSCTFGQFYNISTTPLNVSAISGANTVCVGNNISLTNASSGGIWSSNNTSVANVNSNGVVIPVMAGTATITYTINNGICTATATKVITVINNSISQNNTLTGCNSVSFNGNVYAHSTTINDTLKSVGGCDSVYRATNINVNANPVIQIQIPIDSCATTATNISTTATYSTYSWTLPNGSILNTSTIVGTQAGSYQLAVTNAQGCSATASFALHNCLPPSIVIAGDSVLCGDEGTREFTASIAGYPTATFEWTDPFGGTSTSNPIVVNNGSAGLYTIVATLPNGSTITKTINISSATAITYTVSGQNLCNGVTVGSFDVTTMGGTAPYTYSWTNNTTSATNTNEDQLNVPYNQDFYGTITDANGCSTGATLYFQVQSPIAVFVNGTTLPCGATSGNVTISATGGLPFYDASGNPYYLGTGVQNLGVGTYTIQVKDSIGCVTSTTFTVTAPCVCSIPQVSIASDYSQGGIRSGKIYYCYGAALTLTGSLINSATYSWTGPNGFTATTRTIQINPTKPIHSGRYTVVASLSSTCFSTGYVDVVVLPQLVVTTSQSISVCPNTPVTLSATASATPVTFYWTYNFASVNPTTFVATTANQGVYLVKAVDAYGCKGSNSLKVNLLPVPTPIITGATQVCVGATIQLAATPTGGFWTSLNNRASINSSTGVLTGLAGGGVASIRYTVTNTSGCTAFTNYSVTVNALPGVPSIGYAAGTPNPQTGPGGAFCTNRTFIVVGTPTGGVWSRTGVISVTTPAGLVNTGSVAGTGTLTYTYTNANGCSNSKSIIGNVVACAFRGAISNEPLVSSNDFKIYPNPAKSFINLNVETLIGKGSIVVTDLYGKQVKTQPLSMGTNTIDVSRLSKGMYFVSIITSEGKSTKKLIIND